MKIRVNEGVFLLVATCGNTLDRSGEKPNETYITAEKNASYFIVYWYDFKFR